MRFIKTFLVALLFFIAITFSLENSHPVKISYFIFIEGVELPLYLIVFSSVVIGIFLGGLEWILEKVRSANKIKRLKKEIALKEKELTSLRNLPLTESKLTSQETGKN